MPPKKTTYSRIQPVPRQTRLSSRRSLPLAHRRDSPPALQKRQSTLTQIDYIRSTPVIPNSSDEDYDSEYEETQPKKKQRLSGGKNGKGRDRDQSTLTQKWDWKAMAAARDSEESDEDLMMLHGEDDKSEEEENRPRPNRQKPTSKGHTQTQGDILFISHLDSDSDSESNIQQPKRVVFTASSDLDRNSTRPTTADSTNPKTPKRIRRSEIPSSQTPASLKLSKHSPKQHEICGRSPLKERSNNLPSLKRSRSPSSELKRAANGRGQSQVLDEQENTAAKPEPWKATLTLTPRKDPVPGKRSLERVTTIQESDTSDVEIDISPIQWTSKKAASPADRQPVQRRRRSLQRVTTIQDSEENCSDLIDDAQAQNDAAAEIEDGVQDAIQERSTTGEDYGEDETILEASKSDPPEIDLSPKRASQSTPPDLDDPRPTLDMETTPPEAFDMQGLESREVTNLQHTAANIDLEQEDDETDDDLNPRVDDDEEEDDDEDDEDYMEEETYPQTYDPVAAALERDAARYGRDTQYESDVEYADDEESVVAESDAGVEIDGDADVEIVPSSQPGETRIRSSQEADDLPTFNSVIHDQPPDGAVDDSGYSSQQASAKRTQARLFVLDDNAPRPSQISTVVDDSQSPRGRPNSAHGMTQKSMPAWPETLSSSPFPLPPGFAMRSQRRVGETQSSGLIDFSLPPPPPLFFSSSRGGDEGS